MFIVNTSDNYELAETGFNMKVVRLILSLHYGVIWLPMRKGIAKNVKKYGNNTEDWLFNQSTNNTDE